MKPKPFWLLNHFTVPADMGDPFITSKCWPRASTAGRFRVLGENVVRQARCRGEANFVRPKSRRMLYSTELEFSQEWLRSIATQPCEPRICPARTHGCGDVPETWVTTSC